MTSRSPIVLLAVFALAVSSLVSAEETGKKEAKKAAAKPVKLRDITLTVPPTWQQE